MQSLCCFPSPALLSSFSPVWQLAWEGSTRSAAKASMTPLPLVHLIADTCASTGPDHRAAATSSGTLTETSRSLQSAAVFQVVVFGKWIHICSLEPTILYLRLNLKVKLNYQWKMLRLEPPGGRAQGRVRTGFMDAVKEDIKWVESEKRRQEDGVGWRPVIGCLKRSAGRRFKGHEMLVVCCGHNTTLHHPQATVIRLLSLATTLRWDTKGC